MTPLLASWVEELAKPLEQRVRAKKDHAGVHRALAEAHCFNFQDVFREAFDTPPWLHQAPCRPPFPTTFFDTGRYMNTSQNVGILVEENSDGWVAHAVGKFTKTICSYFYNSECLLFEKKDLVEQELLMKDLFTRAFFCMALLYRHDIAKWRSHPPLKSLQKRLNRSGFAGGKFPLKAWTEIVIDLDAVREEERRAATGSGGLRAFHWVRGHWWGRHLPQPRWVPAYTRGDASRGICQSRYRVEGGVAA